MTGIGIVPFRHLARDTRHHHTADIDDWLQHVLQNQAQIDTHRIENAALLLKAKMKAKAALKELRHKKRELKFLRGALAKQHKAAKGKRPRKGKAEPSGVATFFDDVRWGIGKMLDGKPEAAPAARPPTPADIEREMRSIDEILGNLEHVAGRACD